MCGIAGVVAKGVKLSGEDLRSFAQIMASAMPYRGPDDEGVWLAPDGRCALAHRRLSIIDTSSGGHQPMVGANGRSALTYNGELYNYLELKAELENNGARFASKSDTEVFLALIERFGTAAFQKFDAMFAIGHYDAGTQQLILARDIFGEKPLYYIDTPDYFAFASELHALAKLPGFDTTVNADTIGAYLSFQYVPAPYTIYRSARKLMPGHWLTRDANGWVASTPYFSFDTSGRQERSRPIAELAEELEDHLVTSMKRRLISDVPLGAFLSGGVDSSTVAAIATQRLGVPLKTYSIGFEGHKDSEHFEAAQISKHLSTHHHERVLAADTIELGSHIGSVLDEPNGDTSCLPTYLLCRFARESVTVALSGDGGDELFGGYGRYFNTVDEWQKKRSGDASLDWWKAGDVYLSSRVLVYPDAEVVKVMGEMPPALDTLLAGMRGRLDSDTRPLLNVLRELDARTYMPGAVLPKVDRMSMQHSLEVRAPLLGMDIAKFAMKLAADDCYSPGNGKLVLKRVAEKYLPAEWMNRPKRGFGLPMDMWGADTLLPVLKDLILSPDCRLAEWINREHLTAYMKSLGQEFHAYRAWSLFILETWLRTHPAKPGPQSSLF